MCVAVNAFDIRVSGFCARFTAFQAGGYQTAT